MTFIFFYFLILCKSMCLRGVTCWWVHVTEVTRGVRFTGAWVTGDCDLFDMDARDQNGFLWKNNKGSKPISCIYSSWMNKFLILSLGLNLLALIIFFKAQMKSVSYHDLLHEFNFPMLSFEWQYSRSDDYKAIWNMNFNYQGKWVG